MMASHVANPVIQQLSVQWFLKTWLTAGPITQFMNNWLPPKVVLDSRWCLVRNVVHSRWYILQKKLNQFG